MVHNSKHMSLEQQLMLRCARTNSTATNETEIHRLIEAGIDWNQFIAIVAGHQVTTLTHNTLKKVAPQLLPTAIDALSRLTRRSIWLVTARALMRLQH